MSTPQRKPKTHVQDVGHDRLAPIIERLYQSVGDDQALVRALRAVAEAVHADVAGVHQYNHRGRTGRATSVLNFEKTWVRAYQEKYSHVNVWMIHGRGLMRPGGIVTSHEMYPDEALDRTEWYNDFLRPLKVFFSMGAVLNVERDATASLTLMRARRSGRFGDSEVRLIESLNPHLGNVLRLHERLAAARAGVDGVSHVLDRLPMAVVVLDDRGAVLSANRAARDLTEEGDGLRLGRDTLTAEGRDGVTLCNLIAQAVGTAPGSGAMRLERPSGRQPLHVWVAPVPSARGLIVEGAAAAAVFITDSGHGDSLDPEILASLYELTPAESRLASELSKGKDLKEAAAALELRLSTVRTQLGSIFLRTGTRRQAELVRLLLIGPARLRRS